LAVGTVGALEANYKEKHGKTKTDGKMAHVNA